MALVSCPECDKQVSDKAKACPGCGCPVLELLDEIVSCPECGLDVLSEEVSCNACGYPLAEIDSESEVAAVQEGRKLEHSAVAKDLDSTDLHLKIVSVKNMSQSAVLGLKVDDIIVSYDDVPIRNNEDITRAASVAKTAGKNKISLIVKRGDALHTFKAHPSALGINCEEWQGNQKYVAPRNGQTQTYQKPAKSNGALIVTGYISSVLAWFVFWPFFGSAGIVIGGTTIAKGDKGHGIAHITISALAMIASVIFYGALFSFMNSY